VAQRLLSKGWDLVFVGSVSGLEERLLAPLSIRYRGIQSGKLRRYFSWQNLLDVGRVAAGLMQAIFIVAKERPAVVFSKGGFVAFPVVVAAWLWRVPVVAHESDVSQGLANRLSGPFIKTLCTSFAGTAAGRFRGRLVHTGAPIRAELLSGDRTRGRRVLEAAGLRRNAKLLLVTGGSLGADALNAAVVAACPQLVGEGWFIAHVCGPGKARAESLPGYVAYEYVSDGWADLLAAADLVVSRAGANTVFELLTLAKPNLLVPLPRSGSRGDQLENAAYAEAAGYSRVVTQQELTAQRLVQEIGKLSNELAQWQDRLAQFERVDAVEKIIEELERTLNIDA
jgi:UDP-N-acetylglucosamine--N-acetylmuramyl-(pentapeptide) pyrophosphoryl-undecaprenol N-acetylglucosamine transferase